MSKRNQPPPNARGGKFDHQLVVTHHQVAVFQPSLEMPFNDWRDEHVCQGFSWRPGSVSFGTIDDGILDVECVRGIQGAASGAVRVIRVPFTVGSEAEVEVATVASNGFRLSLPAGEYALTFEHGRTEDAMWCRLVWHGTSSRVMPAVVWADSGLDPPDPLIMEAEPAR
jgi:competence protein J (ComJ)